MEKSQARRLSELPGCWVKGCLSLGVWIPKVKIPGGTLEIEKVQLCTYHANAFDPLEFLKLLLAQPGVERDLNRQLAPYDIEMDPSQATVEFERGLLFVKFTDGETVHVKESVGTIDVVNEGDDIPE